MSRYEGQSVTLEHRASLANADILVVPGLGGSGRTHWQSLFENRHANARRVQQEDWRIPLLDAWAERIAAAARATDRPVLVLAHSYGCLATVRAATTFAALIAAALLVAPANPDRFGIADTSIRCRMDAISMVIASNNDPWLKPSEALGLAKSWDSDYLNLGPVGHINVASGFGHWPALDGLASSLYRAMAETDLPIMSHKKSRCAPSGALGNADGPLHRSAVSNDIK
jgi:predicted alpha/beta hydrolase family esterase